MIEKLIELLNKAHSHLNSTCIGHGCDSCAYGRYDDCAERIKAEYLIANGVTVQKWIPVTERLPEVDTPVLTYRETGQNVELLWQRGCEKRWDYDEFTPYPVTHWQALPEPPKGE